MVDVKEPMIKNLDGAAITRGGHSVFAAMWRRLWNRGRKDGSISAALVAVSSARVSLRTKGVVAFLVLVTYISFTGFLLAQQRAMLLETVEQQSRAYVAGEALGRVNSSLAYAILRVNEAYSTPISSAMIETIVLDVEAVQAGLEGIRERYPSMSRWITRLGTDLVTLKMDRSGGSQFMLRDSLHSLVGSLDELTREVRHSQQSLSSQFRRAYDSIALTAVVTGLIGVVFFGALVLVFFSRLVRDIQTLQTRAMELVKGHRGESIAVSRHDELGSLMKSVNEMQSVLREREAQLEVTRQRRFHHEKMAAVGSLAAAIAHEVNNPIAAIAGVAEAIRGARDSHGCPGTPKQCRPELILEHARRISDITRQLADMTALHSPEAELVDLNALVRSTCAFVQYDSRFRQVEFRVELDPQVPAVRAVADHLTQVLMNLLINAADATAGIADRKPTISVETSTAAVGVMLEVTDNGCGMDQQTLACAFEEGFTTKPPGRGSGLGLSMSRSLIEAEGGRITLASEPNRGTRASMHLSGSKRG